MSRASVYAVLSVAGLAAGSATAAQPWVMPVSSQDRVSIGVHAMASGHDCSRTCAVDMLERAMFNVLPVDQRLAIARGMAERGMKVEAYERVAHLISRENYEGMRPEWKRAMDFLAENGNRGIAACFADGTDPEIAMAFNELLYGQQARFQPGERWASTAYSGGGLGQGDPTIISYSFVPDGTTVLDAGFGSGGSQLFQWLNGIYGSPAVWQPFFHDVFDRWGEVSGNTYIFEPTDDGVSHSNNNNPGVQGVRGDVRIAAIPLDGGGGVLAYNFFPQNGDMVLDAFDSFYSNTGGASIRLRNIISHEHGHGKGAFHVCPANGTKLMEPFINTNFDGPQLDDILLAQRLYGDPLENNNNAGEATPLSSAPFQTLSQLSIDDNSDQDWFAITLSEAQQVTVTVTPTGATYLQGPQTQACNTGSSFDSLRIHNLSVQVRDTNGTTILGSANNGGLGDPETVNVIIENPGTYYIRVIGDSTNNIQAYSLFVGVEDLPFLPLDIDLVGAAPEALEPGVATPISVTIDPRDEVLTPGSARLRFRNDGGAFQSIPLVLSGGNTYTASLPASLCGSEPEFYFEAQGDQSGLITLPENGASAPFTAIVGEIQIAFSDNFNSDRGWTVTNSGGLTDGAWQRAVPAGASDARVSDPPADFDGSAFCYVTDNGLDNSDVDGGSTTLTSPVFALAAQPEAVISYARWFDNNEGGSAANPFTETFVVQISNNNGGSWVNLEVVGPTGPEVSGGWFEKAFRVADFVAPTDQVRIRFIASDDTGTVVEAGVDAVRVQGLICEDPTGGPCNPADLAEPFGVLDLGDVNAFVTAFVNQDPAADLAPPIGVLDLSDLSTFVTSFTGGCP